MNYIFVITIICSLITGLHVLGKEKGFEIKGTVKGLKDGSNLYLVVKRDWGVDTVSRAISKNERFTFKNVILSIYPDFYLISIETAFVDNLKLFLDNRNNITITGILDSWPRVAVSGSEVHNDYLYWKDKLYPKLSDEWDALDALSGEAAATKQTGYKELARKYHIQFIKDKPASFYIPYLLLHWKNESGQEMDIETKQSFYVKLTSQVKDSYYGKLLGNHIQTKLENAKRLKRS